ncbi:NADH-quinone oxidoreductase subunit NuoI [Thermococcus waiotapuensis]|uniref:NADH-quinone oxidoreductase subunit NuoI n=1 Tax=Thermococcus waiotapuensis TaxID=90909 RepID=A0AAE4T4D8_9EURY|nr:NADH-quinone oxidoreductase subunit NuoI [Thermococcus waiotapuensis]MDV3104798.1 NADH-quinone oxidoreductase subunit NuoI [Thermococcus waiotapuensis]
MEEVTFKIAQESKVRKKPSFIKPWLGLKYLFKKPVTIKIPYETIEPAKDYRGFHTLNWKTCIGCNMCGQICPARAIEMTWIEGEKRPHPKIDYGRCTFCQFCVEVCPTGALGFVESYMLTTEWKEEELQLFDWVPIPPEKFREIQEAHRDWKFPVERMEFNKETREVTYHLRDGTEFRFRILGYGLKPPAAKPAEKKEAEKSTEKQE